jgi:hypothetical protein
MRGTAMERRNNAEMGASEVKYITFKDAYPPGGRMSSVRRDAAVGTITLQWMLFLMPSIATVLLRPTTAILAALQQKHQTMIAPQQPHITTITHKPAFFLTTKPCFLSHTGKGTTE